MNDRPYVITHLGHHIYYDDIDSSQIEIEDIAHALSNICRFIGHVKEFYSVAQHCVYLSHLVPKQYALCALMHDAAEAYIHDLASPLKEAIGNLYKMYEDEFLVKIFRRFGVGNSSVLPDVVKSYDKDLTIHELRSLLYSNFYQNPVFASVRNLDIVPFTPVQAKRAFLTRYWEVLNIVSR